MTVLTFKFSSTECNGWPKLRFCVDDDVLVEYDFDSDTASVDIPLDLIDGNHVLEIERYGKTEDQTNQLVTLEDIYIQDVRLPDWFKSSGTFYFHDQAIQSGLIWHPNGKFILSFCTPIINWFVDQRLERWGPIESLFNPSQHNKQRLHQSLAEFKQELNDVKV